MLYLEHRRMPKRTQLRHLVRLAMEQKFIEVWTCFHCVFETRILAASIFRCGCLGIQGHVRPRETQIGNS